MILRTLINSIQSCFDSGFHIRFDSRFRLEVRIESNRIESIFYQYRINLLFKKKVRINPRKKEIFAFIYDLLISILID